MESFEREKSKMMSWPIGVIDDYGLFCDLNTRKGGVTELFTAEIIRNCFKVRQKNSNLFAIDGAHNAPSEQTSELLDVLPAFIDI